MRMGRLNNKRGTANECSEEYDIMMVISKKQNDMLNEILTEYLQSKTTWGDKELFALNFRDGVTYQSE